MAQQSVVLNTSGEEEFGDEFIKVSAAQAGIRLLHLLSWTNMPGVAEGGTKCCQIGDTGSCHAENGHFFSGFQQVLAGS